MYLGISKKEFHFLLDDESSLHHGFRIKSRCEIPAPSQKFYEYDDVLGRDGSIRTPTGTFSEMQIELECNFATDPDKINSKWRDIKTWLLGNTSKMKLIFSDDLDWFKKVSKIELSSLTRVGRLAGEFTITFTVDPFDYAIAGTKEYDINEVIYNPYWKCEPVYKVTRKDMSSKSYFEIKVNGNDSVVLKNMIPSRSVYIDVPRRLVYTKNDKTGALSRYGRSGMEGDLMIKSKMNTIQYTDGYEIRVTPNWRSI